MYKKMILEAAQKGYTFIVRCDGEIDYRGQIAVMAIDAIEAVEEAEVRFIGLGLPSGWALIIPSLDKEEQIADCSGIVEDWC